MKNLKNVKYAPVIAARQKEKKWLCDVEFENLWHYQIGCLSRRRKLHDIRQFNFNTIQSFMQQQCLHLICKSDNNVM
jgi:hypothetical protein